MDHSPRLVDSASLRRVPFEPPDWAKSLKQCPSTRLRLASLPTPVERWVDVERAFFDKGGPKLLVKRDDLTGCLDTGNKLRKLDFLMADALDKGCDCIISIGGEQSNHIRACAAVASRFGLEAHLVVRTDNDVDELRLRGNHLLYRSLGAYVHLVTVEQYQSMGASALLARCEQELLDAGKTPYVIPMGGSDEVGVWGYIMAVDEILGQMDRGEVPSITDIIVPMGSGGTAAGVALGTHLSGMSVKVHGICVCDDKDVFLRDITRWYEELGVEECADDMMHILDGYVGLGYGINTEREMDIWRRIIQSTGIMLDTTYSLKAMIGFLSEVEKNPAQWEGRTVLFIFTGGIYSIFAKGEEEVERVLPEMRVKRLL